MTEHVHSEHVQAVDKRTFNHSLTRRCGPFFVLNSFKMKKELNKLNIEMVQKNLSQLEWLISSNYTY
jgi:hypothetical protein